MKNQSSVRQFQDLSRIAFMAALIAAGAWFQVQLGPVPITFQDMFTALAGLALGPVRGPLAVLLYLLAGLAGLPVFSAGRSGLGAFLGPTGGYLIGFVGLAFCAGLGGRLALKGLPDSAPPPVMRLIPAVLGCCAGMIVVYALGVAQLMRVMEFDLATALTAGVWPFLPFALVKLVLVALLWRSLRRRGLTV